MITELGLFCLILSLCLALLQTGLGFRVAYVPQAAMARSVAAMAPLQFILTAASFAALMHAYITSDFSVANVVANSHSAKPLLYRVTGTWGNHEGSILLWALVLSLCTALFSLTSKNMPHRLRFNALAVQALISIAFLSFILFTSNPFERLNPAPAEGRDLNPLLQDIGLALHPPLLYLGYVGFSVCYAFAVAALLDPKQEPVWARWMRPWCLGAWIFLTLGIAMGSYWAYYELGWGGFWFWDPVENASFMPWLVGIMLMHTILVTEKRGSLQRWTLLLAVSAFSLSLIGTFLVRSGVLTSVHSFATDPNRGLAILVILAVFIGGAFALYAVNAARLGSGNQVNLVSRETSLVLNNVFLSAATAAVLTGTLYPLLLEVLTGTKISVGPPYFNITFGWTMVPLLLLLPFGPFLAWKKADLSAALRKARIAIALGLAAIVLVMLQAKDLLTAGGIGLAIYVMAGALAEPLSRLMLFRAPGAESWQRFKGFKLSTYGTLLGHFGMGLSLLGIVCALSFAEQKIVTLKQGESAFLGGSLLTFDALKQNAGVNFTEDSARFSVRQSGLKIGEVESSKRFYPVRQMPTTEAGLFTIGLSQLYVSFSEWRDGAATFRLYHKPLILLIWIGALVIALGGALSLLRLFTKREKA